MSEFPWFNFFASDYLGSTKRALMDHHQRSGYVDLMCHQWNDPTCSLPDDDDILAVLSDMGEGWFNGGSVLVRTAFPPHPELPGRIANPKLLAERARAVNHREKSREGGRKSGESRRQAAQLTQSRKGGSGALASRLEPKAKGGRRPNPSANPRGSSSKEEEQCVFPDPLNTDRFRETWDNWLGYRADTKTTYASPRSVKCALTQLAKIGEDNAVAAIEEAIGNGWKGFQVKNYLDSNGKPKGVKHKQREPTAEELANWTPYGNPE